MDHMMPGMDGMETTAAIRGLTDEKLSTIPVVALTANAVSGMKEMFLSHGFNDYISKPIEINELDRIMYTWVPKDKHQSTNVDTKVVENTPGGINSIEGINVEQGLNRFGGKQAVYERILLSFASSLDENIKGLPDLYEDGKYSDLCACLHSIKGISGNVDCTELYTWSISLEDAVKALNYEYVDNNLQKFVEKAKMVKESILLNLS
jgi:CheY-like chemotaxis protein